MAASASSAVFTCGTTMPWAPDSTAERMRKVSFAPTLTSGVSPDTSAARMRLHHGLRVGAVVLHVEHHEIETGVADDLHQVGVVGVHLHAQRGLARLQGRQDLVGSKERFEGHFVGCLLPAAVVDDRLDLLAGRHVGEGLVDVLQLVLAGSRSRRRDTCCGCVLMNCRAL